MLTKIWTTVVGLQLCLYTSQLAFGLEKLKQVTFFQHFCMICPIRCHLLVHTNASPDEVTRNPDPCSAQLWQNWHLLRCPFSFRAEQQRDLGVGPIIQIHHTYAAHGKPSLSANLWAALPSQSYESLQPSKTVSCTYRTEDHRSEAYPYNPRISGTVPGRAKETVFQAIYPDASTLLHD